MNAARAKLRADMAPMQKVHQQEMAEVRAILTPDQPSCPAVIPAKAGIHVAPASMNLDSRFRGNDDGF
jgi:hypothetical protein